MNYNRANNIQIYTDLEDSNANFTISITFNMGSHATYRASEVLAHHFSLVGFNTTMYCSNQHTAIQQHYVCTSKQ